MNGFESNKIYVELEKALEYYTTHANIREILEQCKWYNSSNIEQLQSEMFDSYIGVYDDDELKERINLLYDVDATKNQFNKNFM